MPALFLASDPGFLGLAKLADDAVRRELIPAVREATTHWKSDAAEFASDLLTRIMPRRSSVMSIPEETEDSDSASIWQRIEAQVDRKL
jgi:hypothetical protein